MESMNNLFNRPPFSTIKKKIENVFGDSQETAYRAALSTFLALSLSTSSMASNPEISSSEKKDAVPGITNPDWRKNLAIKKDSLSHEIVQYEQVLLDRVVKGTPYETKKSINEKGLVTVVKSFRVSPSENHQSGSRVDVTYQTDSGLEKPVAIAVTEYDTKSQQQITVMDGAYDKGITGEANYIKIIDSKGKDAASVGFIDENGDGLYEMVGTVQPAGEHQILEAYVKAQILYDYSLKNVLHISRPKPVSPDTAPQKIQPEPIQNNLLSQNIDN